MMKTYTTTISYCDQTVHDHFECLSRADTPEQYLEQIFAEWNNGSGRESERFLSKRCRSLSVGDFVYVNERWYRCESMGWKHQTIAQVNEWFETFEGFMNNMNPEIVKGRDESTVKWIARRQTADALGLYI